MQIYAYICKYMQIADLKVCICMQIAGLKYANICKLQTYKLIISILLYKFREVLSVWEILLIWGSSRGHSSVVTTYNTDVNYVTKFQLYKILCC